LKCLRDIFKVFDLDGGGDIGEDELFELGTARRKLGQKSSPWTMEQTHRMMANMKGGGKGDVKAEEFAAYFHENLAYDRGEFDVTMKQFLEVAHACARKKKEAKDTKKKDEEARKKREADEAARKKKEADDADMKRRADAAAAKKRQAEEDARMAKRAEAMKTKDEEPPKEYRLRRLKEVFKLFDLDGGGDIGEEELYELGVARRKLGQKSGEWTMAQTHRMMANMKGGGKGDVKAEEFAAYFHENLAYDRGEFDVTMKQFETVANDCRAKVAANRKNKADEEAERKRKAEADAAAERKRKADEEAERKRKADEAAAAERKRKADAEATERKRKADEEAERKRKADEAERLRREEEEKKRDRDEKAYRYQRLGTVHVGFDVDKSGWIGRDDLQELGQARRNLGQKSTLWTKEQNDRLCARIIADGDGQITKSEFQKYFHESIAKDRPTFDTTMEQFLEVAKEVGAKKKKLLEDQMKRWSSPPASPQVSPRSTPKVDEAAERKYRVGKLKEVFEAFDLDGDGKVDTSELQQLGTAPRTVGQKTLAWTKDANEKLIQKMDNNRDGLVDKSEFSGHFHDSLPKERATFDAIITQFMEVGRACASGSHKNIQEENRRMAAELAALKKQLRQQEVDALTTESRFQARIKELERELAELKAALAAAKAEIGQQAASIEHLEKLLAEKEETINILRKQLEEQSAFKFPNEETQIRHALAHWKNKDLGHAFNKAREECRMMRRRVFTTRLVVLKLTRSRTVKAFDDLRHYAESKVLKSLEKGLKNMPVLTLKSKRT